MTSFDHAVLTYLNHIAHDSPILTKVIVAIYGNSLITGFFVALFWWIWFDERDIAHQRAAREKIIAGLLGSLGCVVIVRLMAALLPFRHRPLTDPLNGLTFPFTGGGWQHWSSFPSDNAALFFLLTVCLLSVSRTIGFIALLDTIFFICFPRVFVGVHYPTDIIGGAVLGIIAGYVAIGERARVYLAKYPLQWMEAHPPSFYASAFLVTFLFANVFWPALSLLMGLKKLFYLNPTSVLLRGSLSLFFLVVVLSVTSLAFFFYRRDHREIGEHPYGEQEARKKAQTEPKKLLNK